MFGIVILMNAKANAQPMEPLTKKKRWALLATVASGLLLITLDNSILYTALPTLTEELGATSNQMLWIINAYPLVLAGLLLGAGTLGDRVGHARMFVIGMILFAIGSIVAAFAPTPETLIAARAGLAVGAAAMMPATLALIRVNFRVERERTIAIAIWGSVSIVGVALGPIIGGTLLEFFWWGSVFLINVPVVVAGLVAFFIIGVTNDSDPSKRWDLASSIFAMVGLVGLVYAIKEIGHLPPSPAVLAVSLAASAIGFVLFVWRQRRLPYPLLDFSIFQNRAFSGSVFAAMLTMFTVGGVQLATTQRFQLVEGFTPLQAGLLVGVLALGTLPTAAIASSMLHVIGLRNAVAPGLALAALGVGIMAFGVSDFWVLVVGLFLVGLGLGAPFSVLSSAITGNVPVKRAGMASSVEEVSFELGSLTAVSILGSVLAAVYTATVVLPDGAPETARDSISLALANADGNAEIIAAASAAYDHAYLTTLIAAGVILAIGAIVTFVMLKNYGPGTKSQLHSEH
jgi:MFS transporter, DHA2 family, multidrug resistance protein